MYGRVLALGLGLVMSSSALAGVSVVDVSFSVQPGPLGPPYAPDADLTIDVLLSRVSTGDPIPVRMLQFDTAASDPALILDLPVTHHVGSVSTWISFWYFLDLPTICVVEDAADCGQKHYVEDDLAGTRPNVISMAYLGIAQSSLEELTIPGDSTQFAKVGEISVKLPLIDGTYTLDLMNPTEGDPDVGGAELHASHVQPLAPFRAITGELGGGTLDLEVGGCIQDANIDFAALDLTEYPCDATLSRDGSNILRFEFDLPVTAPVPGMIEINEMLSPGVYGPDLSASFGISVVGGNVLAITETGSVFANNTWYAVRNIGNWCDAGNFEVNYAVSIGDADGFGGTGFSDLASIFNVIQGGLPGNSLPDSTRFDIDGLGGVAFADLSAAFAFIPSSPGAKPGAPGCTP